jgi:hypothetical protein
MKDEALAGGNRKRLGALLWMRGSLRVKGDDRGFLGAGYAPAGAAPQRKL